MMRLLALLFFSAASRAAKICCPEIGCFDNKPPFNNLPLPWCMSDINPNYTMYTRSNNGSAGESFDAHSVPPAFNGSRRTVLLVHGYFQNSDWPWMSSMKDAFLEREDINVVILDWRGGADIIDYFQAASNTRSTGAYTALVVDNLVSSGGGSYSRMWCAGHSLGAHLCGHTGAKTTLKRITGMDPAGPSFESSPDLTIGLNPSCASFVDVIHTNANFLGTLRPLGHIDFYPAGGKDQPGCLLDINLVACSHFRAYVYMEQSVREDCFQSRSSCSDYSNIPNSCSSCTCGSAPCAYMGYAANYGCHLSGVYYLDISLSSPYCVG